MARRPCRQYQQRPCLARLRGLEPLTPGLACPLRLSTPRINPGLGSGLSHHHLRCRTYSLYGARPPSGEMMVATSVLKTTIGGFLGIAISPEYFPAVKVSPIQCDSLHGLRSPMKAPRADQILSAPKGRCSIRLSYRRIRSFSMKLKSGRGRGI